ncbi:retrotransposon nucleocapsid protein [Gigaspora margarita]|uniref:Retrotransposon nucleocapsid protein n=1 Tax=Gigaspora margarita TaxID=4874 RepID=A0A8H4B0N5_GIGMA|nr:retrotransposon nucleocapsid protein [Gigaspora margarita]
MNNSICRAHNKKSYELVYDVTPYSHSAALDHLFKTSFFSKDEISNEFGLENIQESVNNLDDLIENTNSIPIVTTKFSSLNQVSNIETQSNLFNDNHESQDTVYKFC